MRSCQNSLLISGRGAGDILERLKGGDDSLAGFRSLWPNEYFTTATEAAPFRELHGVLAGDEASSFGFLSRNDPPMASIIELSKAHPEFCFHLSYADDSTGLFGRVTCYRGGLSNAYHAASELDPEFKPDQILPIVKAFHAAGLELENGTTPESFQQEYPTPPDLDTSVLEEIAQGLCDRLSKVGNALGFRRPPPTVDHSIE